MWLSCLPRASANDVEATAVCSDLTMTPMPPGLGDTAPKVVVRIYGDGVADIMSNEPIGFIGQQLSNVLCEVSQLYRAQADAVRDVIAHPERE